METNMKDNIKTESLTVLENTCGVMEHITKAHFIMALDKEQANGTKIQTPYIKANFFKTKNMDMAFNFIKMETTLKDNFTMES